MFPSKVLLSLIIVSLAVVGASPSGCRAGKATLRLATRMNMAKGAGNIAKKDRDRARRLKNADRTSTTNALYDYTTQVGVGTPPTDYTLLIDTGSSNTWIGASKPYVPTSTSQDTGHEVAVRYGSGNFSGREFTDTITLAPNLVVKNQSIAVGNITLTSGTLGFDGILGVGPVDLTEGTVSNVSTVSTVMDNLFAQGEISEEVLSVYFVPASALLSNGTLTFGGCDSAAITSMVDYVSLTTTYPASKYWGIDQSISYGSDIIMSSTAGIVDTGTTLILIATDAFNAYQSATGATFDQATTGLLMITLAQYSALQTLKFNIGGKSYDLSPNAQIWPRSLNTAIGGSSTLVYLIVGDIGNSSGSGLDFINGYTFLERFYSIFDTTNGRVGFATTAYTEATTN